MNQRNTYLNSKAAFTNQKDRPTANLNNSITKTNTQKTSVNIDRTISKILHSIGMLPNFTTTTTISRQSLKGAGSKVFFDVFYIFLRAIDHKIDRQSINIESITDTVRMMCYNGNINKNIFQPVGAPHTWIFCLLIIQWLSQLATFTCNYNAVKQDHVLQEDFNSLCFEAYASNEDTKVMNYFNSEIQKLRLDISDCEFKMSTKSLALNNLKFSQRQISVVEKEIEQDRQMLFRSKEQIIEKDRTLGQLRNQNDRLQERSKQRDFQLIERQKICEDLKHQISNQELNVQQMEQLKRKLQELQTQELKFQYKIRNCLTSNNKNCQQLIGFMLSIKRQLQQIYQRAKLVSQISHIQLQEISGDINLKQFQTYFKNEKAHYDDILVKHIIGENIVEIIIQKVEYLLKTLKDKLEEARKGLDLCQSQISTIEGYRKRLKNDIQQVKTRIVQRNKTINTKNDTVKRDLLITDETNYNQKNLQQLLKSQKEKISSLMEEIKNIKDMIKKITELTAHFQQTGNMTVIKRRAMLQQHKQKTWNIVQQKLQNVKKINHQIQQQITQLNQRKGSLDT